MPGPSCYRGRTWINSPTIPINCSRIWRRSPAQSVGPNGGQMYIDGFTAGQLPPKSSIREDPHQPKPLFGRISTSLGYGRIEIFTKPGTEQIHGQFMVIGNDRRSTHEAPFWELAQLPGYDTFQFNGNIGGPLSKKASFFLDAQYREHQ